MNILIRYKKYIFVNILTDFLYWFSFQKEKSAQHHDRLKLKNDKLEAENQELQQSMTEMETKVRKLETQDTKVKRNRERQLQQENEKLLAQKEAYQ